MSIRYRLFFSENLTYRSSRIIDIKQLFSDKNIEQISLSYEQLSSIFQQDIGETLMISKIRFYNLEGKESYLLKRGSAITIKKTEERMFEIEALNSMIPRIGSGRKLIEDIKNEVIKIKDLINSNEHKTGDSLTNVPLKLVKTNTEWKDDSNFGLNLSRQESQFDNSNQIPDFNSVSTDFAFLYSCPLIASKTENKNYDLHILNYENDISQIQKSLEKANCEINMICCPGTIEKLKEVLSKKPKILHIVCHGDIQNRKEHFLYFENDKFDGKAKIVSESALIDNLRHKEKEIKNLKLIFINACHSENIGKAFRRLGCTADIIAIQSSEQILDEAARDFAAQFYSEIASKNTVKTAFDASISALKGSKRFQYCCCEHNLPHSETCRWNKYKEKYGASQAHKKHDPNCFCRLNDGKHNSRCKWAKDFYREFKDYDWEERCQDSESFEAKTGIVCCCTELSHDEISKFVYSTISGAKPISSDDLLAFNKDGTVRIERSVNLKFKKNIKEDYLMQLNTPLQNIIENLINEEKKVINIYGPPGCGKGSLAMFATKYACERKAFKNGYLWIDFKDTKIPTSNVIIKKLSKELFTFELSKNEFLESLINIDKLIIIDKAQYLIEKIGKLLIEELLKPFSRCSIRSKIIIITINKLEYSSSAFSNVEIPKLYPESATEFFVSKYERTKNIPQFLNDFLDIEELKQMLFLKREEWAPKLILECFEKFKSDSSSSKEVCIEIIKELELEKNKRINYVNKMNQLIESNESSKNNWDLYFFILFVLKEGVYIDDLSRLKDKILKQYFFSNEENLKLDMDKNNDDGSEGDYIYPNEDIRRDDFIACCLNIESSQIVRIEDEKKSEFLIFNSNAKTTHTYFLKLVDSFRTFLNYEFSLAQPNTKIGSYLIKTFHKCLDFFIEKVVAILYDLIYVKNITSSPFEFSFLINSYHWLIGDFHKYSGIKVDS